MNVVALPSPMPKPDESKNCTDLGNAKRLVAKFGSHLHYCVELKVWFVWNEQIWERDHKNEVENCAKCVARIIYAEASSYTPVNRVLANWALSSESAGHIGNMLSLAKSEKQIPVSINEFDTDPFLLGVQNGTVDLRTIKFRRACQSDLITKQAGVIFDPTAKCPRWEKFINEFVCNRNVFF